MANEKYTKVDTTPSAEEIVLYEKDPKTKIATITLNRPDRLNAVTVESQHRFADLVHRANIDDDVKVLVIRGKGEHFGSGADLPELLDMMANEDESAMLREFKIPNDGSVNYPKRDSYRHLANNVYFYTNPVAGMRSLQEFKKISILEVSGYCYGWHFYQAGDVDLIVASDDALFGHASFRYVGWAPRQWQWATMMGLRKFQEMVFTGRPFTAKEMYECGFVNAVAPRDRLEATTQKYALACSRSRPTDTVVMQKAFFEIYKQHQGEYMGSILSAWLESMAALVKNDGTEMNVFDDKTRDAGLANAVRDNDSNFPPEWRLSRRGRKAKE